jgi:hypothetical protein
MNNELKRTLECIGISTIFISACMLIYILLVIGGILDVNY